MELVKDLLLVLHFIGLAGIIGGVLVQWRSRSPKIDALVLHGALTQLVTGLALVGINEALADDGEAGVNHTKVAVKLLVLVVILVLAWVHRKRDVVPTWVWAGIGGLTVANIAIAVLW